jgi:hypothetical protein
MVENYKVIRYGDYHKGLGRRLCVALCRLKAENFKVIVQSIKGEVIYDILCDYPETPDDACQYCEVYTKK